MKERKDDVESKKKELEDAYRVKKRTVDLLPDAENNIVKLEVCAFYFSSNISAASCWSFIGAAAIYVMYLAETFLKPNYCYGGAEKIVSSFPFSQHMFVWKQALYQKWFIKVYVHESSANYLW